MLRRIKFIVKRERLWEKKEGLRWMLGMFYKQ